MGCVILSSAHGVDHLTEALASFCSSLQLYICGLAPHKYHVCDLHAVEG